MLVPRTRLFTMFSNPTNAPPAINKMLVVSISIISPDGCFRPPVAVIRHLVPSTNLSKACCTPSPDTSRVILEPSLFLVILSISSTNIIPCCVFSTLLPDAANNLLIRLSTSSPTYPASVKLVASAITNGTSK